MVISQSALARSSPCLNATMRSAGMNWSSRPWATSTRGPIAVTLSGAATFGDGNYASNLLYANLRYGFDRDGGWQPYVGAGLTWLQEIDIDLERAGDELSYSGGGETGFQVFAGVNYDLSQKWTIQSELRYGSITGIDLEGEGNDIGEFDGIDYETTTLQIGLVFDF